MLRWYDDAEVGIFFDNIPRIGIRFILPSTTDEEKQSIKKYPFINKTTLKVRLFDKTKGKIYDFEIPKGYCYDGASIPRFFWRIIGAPTDNNFLVAALIHDVLCENHSYIENDRAFSTKVFNSLLKVSNVGSFKRFCMKNSVDIFQKFFCNWKK